MSTAPTRAKNLYLPGVEANPQPGVYRDLIEAAKSRSGEYSKIWDLFAYRQDFTIHMGRFTHGLLRSPASISPGLRELIAAYTSYLNECGFCTQAHAATAAELLGSEELVWSVLRDLESSPINEKEKVLFRYVQRLTKALPSVGADDVETLRAAGWDDEAIYYAITTCALFNFYNRWITGTGVPEMSREAHREQGRQLASRGYTRG
ncbi:MAG TPA: peroxidase-related enzyme [Vicinamibacterales bacterium]|nr:peroxidase-related enzyme [Vicinamibacterales bacterium]